MVAALGSRAFGRRQHLLIGQHRAELGTIPDRRVRNVGEALLIELDENPLGPFVVGGIGRVDLARPVIGKTDLPDLAAEIRDVPFGRLARMGAGLHGVLLGGQAEGVPAHGMEDVEAAHPLVARNQIAGDVALGMADMQPRAGGVREHVERVVLRLFAARLARIRGAERALLEPVALPRRLECGERKLLADLHGGGKEEGRRMKGEVKDRICGRGNARYASMDFAQL